MTQFTRRRFLGSSLGLAGLGLAGASLPNSVWGAPERKKLPVAAVVTAYANNTHADVIIGKILDGYRQDGGTGPDLEVVSLFTDQVPEGDLSRKLAEKHGFRIADSIEDAITLGTDGIPVAGVICVGEHGKYPYTPDTNQHMYPRRRFFDGVVDCFRKFDKTVPIFNDKHLGYAWKDAEHMYRTAQEMKIPFLAGSSIPVAWRSPQTEIPLGSKLTSAIGIGYGGLEAYGFHCLEGMQCMLERRKGGETGVASVQTVQGDQVAEALKDGRWSRELLNAAANLTPPPGRRERPKDISPKSVFYLIEYRDGLRAAIAMGTGLSHEFAAAVQIEGEKDPFATWFRLEYEKPFGHFQYLVQAIEHLVHEKASPYPIERTLLTTGILDAALHSHADGGKRIETPHLNIAYQPTDWAFAKGNVPGT